MTPAREAFLLPGIFLTVTLLGGLRIGTTVQLVPPPLVSLVLAMLVAAALVRTGALIPERFLSNRRQPLENMSGAVVLLTLFSASAQVFNLVTPERGLLHLLFSAFFTMQLLTTMAAAGDRRAFLRSLLVLLGSAFVLRFVVLEPLYSPDGGMMKRVLTAVMEGVTLGTLDYEPHAAATGYIAFLTLALYFVGLVLVDGTDRPATAALQHRPGSQIVGVLAIALIATSCGNQDLPPPGRVGSATTPDVGLVPKDVRDASLVAARVWQEPAVPVSRAALGDNPSGPKRVSASDDISCRFVLERVGGTTPKFDCQLPDGELIKVKYGATNPELHAEVAATRLLTALGFGADHMYVVRTVRCLGCPAFPFPALKCWSRTGIERACFVGALNYDKAVEFDAVIERRIEGRKIESKEGEGWAWFELDRIDPARGGSTRAEVDALRLLAVVLSHWDNKSENQRLICLPGSDRPDGSCGSPFAIIQDLGATFGPLKLDLHNWRSARVWADARSCRVSMEALPFRGATFGPRQISEGGRRMLLGLLEQLSRQQLEELFSSSRVTTFDGLIGETRSPSAWAAAFEAKVRQIREAGPCPES